VDESKEIYGFPIITRGDSPEVLEPVNASFDAMALRVDLRIINSGILAVRARWNDRDGTTLLDAIDERLAVIAFVGNHMRRFPPPHQRWGLREWHEVKLQYTAVSRLCVPLIMVGVAASKLGPACDGAGCDPSRSSCRKAAEGMNPSNCREKNDFRLTSCHSAKSLKPFKSV
jgi:hypothetical protein